MKHELIEANRLLDQLATLGDRAPLELIEAAAAQDEPMWQAMRARLDEPLTWNPPTHEAWWLPHHIAFILGRMDSAEAGVLLVDLIRRMDREADMELLDWLSPAWPGLLANKPESVHAKLRELVTDRSLDWFTRSTGQVTLLILARDKGGAALEQAIDAQAGVIADEDEDWELRIVATTTLLDFPRERHRELMLAMVREQADRQDADEYLTVLLTAWDIDEAFERAGDCHPAGYLEDPWVFYQPQEIAARQTRWQAEAEAAARERREKDAQLRRRMHEMVPDGSAITPVQNPPDGTGVRVGPKTGRNDPCPCGSGKKYKKCCAIKDQQVPASELVRRRVRRDMQGVARQMLDHAVSHYGSAGFEEAWNDFNPPDGDLYTDEPLESRHAPAFLPWFLFCWWPDPGATDVADASLEGIRPAELFLRERSRYLSPTVLAYLQSLLAGRFSFFEVLEVQPGEGLVLQDILDGRRHQVADHQASRMLKPHNLVYALLGEVDGVSLFEGTVETVIPTLHKLEVLRLRDEFLDEVGNLPNSAEGLEALDHELRELLFEILDQIHDPRPPRFVGAEGEDIEFHDLVYDINSSRAAFDGLARLALGREEADWEDATVTVRDANGEIEEAEFPINWTDEDPQFKAGSIHATVRIEGRRLTVEATSRSRADWIKRWIATNLGGVAKFRLDTMQTVGQAMANRTGRKASARPLSPEMPEVRTALLEMLKKHYADWVDISLPALDGRTPREEAATPGGRERVAVLLDSAMQVDLGLPVEDIRAVFQPIRAQLGLD